MESYTLEEMEKRNSELMKRNRGILDHLKSEYDENKFTEYEIEENKDGYTLKKEDLSYVFERNKLNYKDRLTVKQKGCMDISFTEFEVLQESNDYEGLKTGIGEFFVRIGALIRK